MIYNILDYGAVPGEGNLNTKAIQNAIDDCTNNGGGTVLIPSGLFITGTLYLKSNVELHLEMGAVLKASSNREDYNPLDAYPENYDIPCEAWDARHFIIAHHAENVAITGLGTINGSAEVFFDGEAYAPGFRTCWNYGLQYQKGFQYGMAKSDNPRPGQSVVFVCCKNVRIIDITIVNSPCWCLFLHGCENVQVRGYKAFNQWAWANTDGLDIDTCKNVTVSDCIMDTGDDDIAIRCDSNQLNNGMNTCENITITNCILSSSSSVFRIGIGNGTIRNVNISNITIPRGGIAFTISTHFWENDRISFEDIAIHNIITDCTAIPFELYAKKESSLKNISFHNYRAKCYMGARIIASDNATLSNVTVRDMHLSIIPAPFSFPLLDNNGHYSVFCVENAKNARFENVTTDISPALKDLFSNDIGIFDSGKHI